MGQCARDVDQLVIGQKAEVRFSAFNQRETPHVEGTLEGLSADRLTEDTAGGKMPYDLARVRINAEGARALTKSNLKLLPGMPAEVLIQTGERTMLSYLLAPIRETLAKGMREN